MAVAEEPKRGRTVPVPQWWTDRANAEIASRGIKRQDLAEKFGVEPSAITRCLKDEGDKDRVTTLELVAALSEELGIPQPVFIPATEAEALVLQGGDGAPRPADPPAVVIRKNLVRFREEAGYDLVLASDTTDIPFETLIRYESGEEEPPGSALVALARAYGRSLGDFDKLEPPPANVDEVPWIHFRFRPPFQPTEQDVAELQEVVRRISQRYRAAKRAQVATFKEAKDARKAKGTKPPPK